jgi:4-hydroxy-3-methylbut-2-enyl diphosphate reductase IspH
VVERLRQLGAVFVVNSTGSGQRLSFSRAGVPAAVENEAARRELTVFDATASW